MGVAAGRQYFAVEQTSSKNGYEFTRDVDGQVFTVDEQTAAWGNESTPLSTDLDLPAVVKGWQDHTSAIKWPIELNSADPVNRVQPQAVEVKLLDSVMDSQVVPPKKDDPSPQDVRWSDEVGSFLCGFIYYTDLVEMGRNGKNKKRDVAFMHVPSLDTEDQLKMGVEVTLALVQSLVETWRGQRGPK
jgi:pyrrolidone-carboxylate peptidase